MNNIVKGLGLVFIGCFLLAIIVIACAVATDPFARQFMHPPCIFAAIVAAINIIWGYLFLRSKEE